MVTVPHLVYVWSALFHAKPVEQNTLGKLKVHFVKGLTNILLSAYVVPPYCSAHRATDSFYRCLSWAISSHRFLKIFITFKSFMNTCFLSGLWFAFLAKFLACLIFAGGAPAYAGCTQPGEVGVA